MALNKFMHPRNIYKDRKPDFKLLSEQYPQFKEQTTIDDRGGVHIDFKKPECLRALSWALLKDDFDLDVLMPLDRLIPTVPLRINYILWLEDILGNTNAKIRGIDIGSGASCVYALLGAKRNNWQFLATEADATNFAYAKKNVENNQLTDKITVKRVSEETSLYDVLSADSETYDFCMCNPPFFGSNFEAWGMLTTRSDGRPEPSSVSTASPVESIVPGGEVEFTKRMINDSLLLTGRIRVYTTMLGKKTSLPVLKEELRRNGVTNISQTEFCQGKTMRWGLGWSFDPTVKFPKAPTKLIKNQKAKPPLVLHIMREWGSMQSCDYTIEDATRKILELFNSLEIEVTEKHKTANQTSFTISATKNTWSNQRRKRRQKSRLSNWETGEYSCMTDQLETSDNMHSGIDLEQGHVTQLKDCEKPAGESHSACQSAEETSDTGNEQNVDLQCPSECKRLRTGDEGVPVDTTSGLENVSCDNFKTEDTKSEPEATVPVVNYLTKSPSVATPALDLLLLSCEVVVRSKAGEDITLEMSWLQGRSREAMHQVMQYLKNKLF